MHRTGKRIISVILAGTLSACAVDAGQKEQIGTLVGAVVGGILGAAVSGRNDRAVGALIGALGGSLIGNQLGRYFDEQDRKNIAEASARVLEGGAAETYVSPRSKAAVTITSSDSVYEAGPSIQALSGVYTASELVMENRAVFVTFDQEALSSPNPGVESTVKLNRGEQVDVLASVPDSEFVLVGRNHVAIGYLRSDNVVSSLAELPSPRKPTEVKPQPQKAAAKSVPPRQGIISTAARPAGKPPVPQPATTVVMKSGGEMKTALLSKECKVLTYAFTLPNGQRSQTSQKSCNEPPSGWQAVTA